MLESKSGFSGFCFYIALPLMSNYRYFSGLASSIQLANCVSIFLNESFLSRQHWAFVPQYYTELKNHLYLASREGPGFWNPSYFHLKHALLINKFGTIFKFNDIEELCCFLLSIIIRADFKAVTKLLKVERINGSTIYVDVEKHVCLKS